MPQYEFICNECHEPFLKTLSLDEYERGETKCPKCGSSKVEQRLSAFYAVTSKKSA